MDKNKLRKGGKKETDKKIHKLNIYYAVWC